MNIRYFAAIFLMMAGIIVSGEEARIFGEINAKSGINIRNAPSVTSEAKWMLPRGNIVEILNKNGPKEIIGGKEGNWYKIKYSDEEYWVFGFYIKERENIGDIAADYDSGIAENKSIFLRIYSYGKFFIAEQKRGSENFSCDTAEGGAEYLKERGVYRLYFTKEMPFYIKIKEYFKEYTSGEEFVDIPENIEVVTIAGIKCRKKI